MNDSYRMTTTGHGRLPRSAHYRGGRRKSRTASISCMIAITTFFIILLTSLLSKVPQVPLFSRKSREPRVAESTVVDRYSRILLDLTGAAKAYEYVATDSENSDLARQFRAAIREAEQILSNPKAGKKTVAAMDKMSALFSHATALHLSITGHLDKVKSKLSHLEAKVAKVENEATFMGQLAAEMLPKSLHCLHLLLSVGWEKLQQTSPENSSVDSQTGNSWHNHYCIISDNVLAVSVVVSSLVANSAAPDRIVLHIVTDSISLRAMKMWFHLHPPGSASLDIRPTSSFTWLNESYSPVMRQLADATSQQFYSSVSEQESVKSMKFHNPKYLSIMNHLRFYLPQMFPDVDKIVFLDDDVVVQKDLSPLFSTDLQGNVNGAVETCGETFHRFHKYLNFSNPLIRDRIDPEGCGWAYGMNVFDLREWARQNLTQKYHYWQQMNANHTLWQLGTLPAGLLTFYGSTAALNSTWHVLGLGYDSHVSTKLVEEAAVVHWNGNKKPWLKIAIKKYKHYWLRYLDQYEDNLAQCRVAP